MYYFKSTKKAVADDKDRPTQKQLESTERWLTENVDSGILKSIDITLVYKAVDLTELNEERNKAFQISQGLIRKIASRYTNLDPAVSIEDLISQSYIGLARACQKYDVAQYGAVKFSTVLTWYIQKSFQELCPSSFMAAELTTPDGEKKSVPYNEFQKIKRHLPVRLTTPDGQVSYMPLSEFKVKEATLPIGVKAKPTEANVVSIIRSLDYSASTDDKEGNLLDTGIFTTSKEGWDEEEKVAEAIDQKRLREKKGKMVEVRR